MIAMIFVFTAAVSVTSLVHILNMENNYLDFSNHRGWVMGIDFDIHI